MELEATSNRVVLMANRKIICIVLALVFGLTLFASGALGQVACDKGQCRHHPMKIPGFMKTGLNFVSKGCCAESQKEPCELEGSPHHVIHDIAFSGIRVQKASPLNIVVMGSNVMSDNLAFGVFGPHLKDGLNVPLPPIYMRNLNLIC